MTEEMTVFGNPSKDTMPVTNTAHDSTDTDHNITQTIDSTSQDTTPTTTTNDSPDATLSDSNWSTNNCIIEDNNNSNSNNNNNTISSQQNVGQTEETFANPDDSLEPIERLEKYSFSDIIFHRQVVARSILETFSEVEPNDVHRVMAVISRLAADNEPNIRAELVEQIPQIGVHLSKSTVLPNGVPHYLLPILEQFLTDTNSQVRKMTQNAFVLMLDQGIVQNSFLEEHICPLLIQLTDFSNLDDFRMEAVGMMSKIVRFLGKKLTEKLLLQNFIRLCADVSFHVRRVCAANFGEFCSVVGQQLTESVLLPKFHHLCQDSIWGVRKCCADVFVPVAITVSNKIRKEVLSPLFVNLLNDQSRWVKTGAFQSLGPFISTFADPSKTGLYYSDNGVIVIEDHSSNDSGCSAGSESAANSPTDIDVDEAEEILIEELPHTQEIAVSRTDSDCNEYSHFQYWRVPIDDIDLSLVESNPTPIETSHDEQTRAESTEGSDSVTSYKPSEESGTNLCDDQKQHKTGWNYDSISKRSDDYFGQSWSSYSFADINCSDFSIRDFDRDRSIGHFNKIDNEDMKTYYDSLLMGSGYIRRAHPSQDIIPNELLENYLSMTNPINYQAIDPDLCHHCAYSLPAVALTLGRQNWPCLRETYEGLAADMQWKVRWTLASSLHQMSQILGSELTTRDLLPIFLAFMKDLDEVRYGILQNLAAFLKLLLRPQQQGILPKISEFLKMDNTRNWRFRHTLCQQIIELVDIYTSSEIREYLYPIGLVLLEDKVSEVRSSAIRLVAVLLKHMFVSLPLDTSSVSATKLDIIDELNSRMAESKKWVQRQAYVMVCQQIIVNHSLPSDLFIDEMLDHLLNLSEDKVPNVRLLVARAMTDTLWPIALFRSHLKVQQTLEDLQSDRDKDVRNQALTVSLDASSDRHNSDN